MGGTYVKRTLVCGFGNLYRRDDGIGRAVVNRVREQLGHAPLNPMDDGFNELGRPVDTVVLHQLVPELAELVADYDLVIFVDAHVADLSQSLREERITPAYRSTSFVSHQTRPATVLELAEKMYGRAPQAVLLSLPGYDFDFGEGLSAETRSLVPSAVNHIIKLSANSRSDDKHNHVDAPIKR
jgi:hydrogenase maturation protease